jgi:hypothetical protein
MNRVVEDLILMKDLEMEERTREITELRKAAALKG